jgi:hypothetical protein
MPNWHNRMLTGVDAKNFSTVWAAYQSTRRLDTGRICVWGMLSPKLYTKCGRPLGGWWCIPSGILQSTRLQYSRRRLRWTNKTNAADQNRLIISDFTSTRTFSNHNTVVTTHEKHITNLHITNKIDLIDWDSVQWTQLFQESTISDSRYNKHEK